MNREEGISQLREKKGPWDVIVIGGGASGLGIALDAASRNYSVLLVEQHDFAKGTSSRSTKLIHGGVRYLQQGDLSMVYEALHERGLMYQNAPHLVHNLSFVIPTYEWWNGAYYSFGLKLYDIMAGRLGLGASQKLSREETIAAIPTIEKQGLRGGVLYHDGQFDDARMAISLAMTATDYGATLINYLKVTSLIKKSQRVSGVRLFDLENSEYFEATAKTVINATGVYVDDIIDMDQPGNGKLIRASQGVHLVVGKDFLPGNHALLIPQTSDGRVLFAIPWKQHVVLGTTDTLIKQNGLEPIAKDEEVKFIIDNASRFLSKKPTKEDIKSAFAGLRPLAAPSSEIQKTKEISRGHKILVSPSGLISVIGGKWTTYRKMAEHTIDKAIHVGGLTPRECITENLLIHGYDKNTSPLNPMHVYGSDRSNIEEIEKSDSRYKGFLSEKLKIMKSQVAWAARKEMARTVEDVLARRTRALFLDINESIKIATETATLLAYELNKDKKWEKQQVDSFISLSNKYLSFEKDQ